MKAKINPSCSIDSYDAGLLRFDQFGRRSLVELMVRPLLQCLLRRRRCCCCIGNWYDCVGGVVLLALAEVIPTYCNNPWCGHGPWGISLSDRLPVGRVGEERMPAGSKWRSIALILATPSLFAPKVLPRLLFSWSVLVRRRPFDFRVLFFVAGRATFPPP